MKLHILGICGTFMGGVAALARELGHDVEGSDQNIYPPMSTQLEQLGIALKSGKYDYEARSLSKLFASKSFTGQVGPAFQWNILNYGRILNNVRFQDFRTQELAAAYQQRVLTAAQEVENGIIAFLNFRREAESLAGSVRAAERAVALAQAQFRAGVIDFTPVFVAEQFLAQQQNLLAQAQGDVAVGLITVYRALGGGWEYRLAAEGPHDGAVPAGPAVPEVLPSPRQVPPAAGAADKAVGVGAGPSPRPGSLATLRLDDSDRAPTTR